MKKSFIISLLATTLLLGGCSGQSQGASSKTSLGSKIGQIKNAYSQASSNTKGNISNTEKEGLSQDEYTKLAKSKFQNGSYGYIYVNNNKSTLNPESWKKNKVVYSSLDNLNRASKPNIGYLEKRNIANDSLRIRQTVEPTGWHYNTRNGEQLYNRGHLIAYSVSAGIDQNGNYNPQNQSGDQNNPKNLFTQTAYSNQQLQTIFEKKVRTALRENKKVIYEATAVFDGNNKMATGVNLQAVSTDGSLNFNVFIYNVQPHYSFNLADGRAKKDNSVVVKELPASLQSHYNDNGGNNRTSLNRKFFKRNSSYYQHQKWETRLHQYY